MFPVGFIAIITGWFTAEIGRQPWVVYNQLRTKDMATHVAGHSVLTSLILLIVVYGIILVCFILNIYLKPSSMALLIIVIVSTVWLYGRSPTYYFNQ